MKSALVMSLASAASAGQMPVVFMHGMGDSCFNEGMGDITNKTGAHLNTYATCIPTGKDQGSDSNNGFFMTMDANVEEFAKRVKADPKLANGFNAVGFSQGNSIIRGYMQKYNNPKVSTWLSVHGTVVGVADFPSCNPHGLLGPVCRFLSDWVVGPAAYTTFVQNHLFQADYYRDPKSINGKEYKTHSQLAQWNNEGNTVDPTIKENFIKTDRFVMIKAKEDSMVYPREGEHWGCYDTDFKTLLTMNETRWYKEDLFGLQTVDKAGKIFFDTTEGNHLQFTEKQLFGWVDKHFIPTNDDGVLV